MPTKETGWREIDGHPVYLGKTLGKGKGPSLGDSGSVVASSGTKIDSSTLKEVRDSKTLNAGEIKAMNEWSNEGYLSYDGIRKAQAGKLTPDADLKDLMARLDSGLRKLPDHEGETYRGMNSITQAHALKTFVKGATLTLDAHTSFSKKRDHAESFALATGNDVSVLLITRMKKGKDIGKHVKEGDGEAEVLGTKGTSYKIVATAKQSTGSGRLKRVVVTMEEV